MSMREKEAILRGCKDGEGWPIDEKAGLAMVEVMIDIRDWLAEIASELRSGHQFRHIAPF
jgi:hypothetical protein